MEKIPEIKNQVRLSNSLSKAFNTPKISLDSLKEKGKFIVNEMSQTSIYDIISKQELIKAELLESRQNFCDSWATNKKIIVAFLPTAVVGAVFYSFIRNTLLASPLVSIYALLFGGVFIIIFEWLHKEKPAYASNLSEISYKKSFLIGCAQSLAVIPGVSRAAATILGGLALGISRKTMMATTKAP